MPSQPLSDSLLSSLITETGDRYSRACRRLYELSTSKTLVRTRHAEQLGVDVFRLVNSTHILTIVLLCDPGVNPVEALHLDLGSGSMSPRMKSKIFFGLDSFTLSISLKMWSPCLLDGKKKMVCVIGCNLAGCCSLETVSILTGRIGALFEKAGRGTILHLRSGFQLVNNVMILYAGKYVTDLAKLIENSPDVFQKYEPGNFPGAFFKASKLRDCRLLIGYTTSLFSLLGCRSPSMLATTLPIRVRIIKQCQTTEEVGNDSKKRQLDRIMAIRGDETLGYEEPSPAAPRKRQKIIAPDNPESL